MPRNRTFFPFIAAFTIATIAGQGLRAQMVTGSGMPGYAETFGIDKSPARGWKVEQTGAAVSSSRNTNVLWPGETGEFTLDFRNTTDEPIEASGTLRIIEYGTRGQIGNTWVPVVFRIGERGSEPLSVKIDPRGSARAIVRPAIPERFGGYALVADLGGRGSALAASVVRVPRARPGRVRFPTLGIDMVWPHEMSESVWTARQRVGVKACRLELGPPENREGFEARLRDIDRSLRWAMDHEFAVMIFIGGGGPQPLGRPRPWLDEKGNLLDTKSDLAWLPSFDPIFKDFVKLVCARYGWPRGPVNSMELWNEPWEGISISGWGADCLRYREIYRAMAQGILEARAEDGVQVLIGGACSSSNTLDKLFPDGTDEFLPILDFTSIHYQPMGAVPALFKDWMTRGGPEGRVKVWDTESWIANSCDRVAVVMASMRAQGQDRANGIYAGNAFFQSADYRVTQGYPPAAAIAAGQHFIGERPFRRILFENGLPWIFIFDGLSRAEGEAPDPEDGTAVVVGDLAGLYEHDLMLFRGVKGLRDPESPVLTGASLALEDGGGRFRLHDFYANPLPSEGGRISIPLDGLGYFLRTDGSPGSFAAMLEALRASHIDGYEPVDIAAHDLTAPIESRPVLRVSITNILNRPIAGSVRVSLGELSLEVPDRLALAPHATTVLEAPIRAGKSVPSNRYPFRLEFDAGPDGKKVHAEDLHVNWIAKRSIRVDGTLDDWTGVPPQTAAAGDAPPSLTEQAWLPFAKWEVKKGKAFATAYLAHDDEGLYFAAKVADPTRDDRAFSMVSRDEDRHFYPEVSQQRGEALRWPEGVRRYSYRRDTTTPSGNFPAFDNVQIAFNALPAEEKPWLSHPAGTMPRFMAYMDTDYEYALNSIAGGKETEIWRLSYPGMTRKHFFPRQPRHPLEGVAQGGRLVIECEEGTRRLECFLPWSEIPHVRRLRDEGRTVKFSFRVNDGGGAGFELAAGRSVSKLNFPAFHVDWVPHWANELEFGFER